MASPREHDMVGSMECREESGGERRKSTGHQAAKLTQAPMDQSIAHMQHMTHDCVSSNTVSCTTQALRASSLLCPHAATHTSTTVPHRQGNSETAAAHLTRSYTRYGLSLMT